MQQSNGYIVGFTVGMTVICAVLLAGVSEYLKPEHKKQEDIDIKTNILSAYMEVPPGADIQELYDQYIDGIVVNYQGEVVEKNAEGNPISAANIQPRKEYKKKDVKDKLFPVYRFKSEVNIGSYDAYIIPVYGNGLWDEIWGYVAIGPDYNTIEGTSFDHKGETPGLGARITTDEFETRFKGKQIFDGETLKSVTVLKGEGNEITSEQEYKVDGLSGATMTTNGVNSMLEKYFKHYKPYLSKSRNSVASTGSTTTDVKVEDLLNHQ